MAKQTAIQKQVVANRARSKKWFEGVIGQEAARRKLGFYLGNLLDNSAAFPHILLEGSQGDGKSYLARKLARNFPDSTDSTKKHKSFIPVDGSALKNLTILFEDVCSKFADGEREVTVFIDEAHGMDKKVQNALLTVTEPNRANRTSYTYNDVPYEFDHSKVTWIFATTEADKIFKPLRDRLVSIQLQPYNEKELAEIILLTIDGRVKFDADTLESLSALVRRNARDADRLAKNVISLGTPVFKKEHLKYLTDELALFPFGLSHDEIRVLKFLEQDGEHSLGHLASRLGKPASACQKELEPYLVSLGFMEIDSKRRISGKGRQFLKENNLVKKK